MGGTARPVSSVLLGDRIVVESVSIRSGEVVVDLLSREPDQPVAAEPTVPVTHRFRLEGGQLVELQ